MVDFNTVLISDSISNAIIKEMREGSKFYRPAFIDECNKVGEELIKKLVFSITCSIWNRLNSENKVVKNEGNNNG